MGLSISIAAARVGHTVTGIDNNSQIISNLKNGVHPVPGINKELVLDLIESGHYIPSLRNDQIKYSEIIIIAVPTPLDSKRRPDLRFLEQASINIGKYAAPESLIVNESTSYPGTLRNFIKPTVEQHSNHFFLYVSAPERVDPGNLNWNLKNTPRVISGLNKVSTEKAIEFYSSFCDQIYEAPNPEVAEASKLFENTFRQVNIALSNEFSEIANTLGFSSSEAIKAASTKPFGFMPFFPSIGVGGHCIPIDPSYLSYAAELAGVQAEFINLANKTNLMAHTKVASKIRDSLGGSIIGTKIQVAGIAYKSNVSDLRESPALLLIDELKKWGAKVTWCDPMVFEFAGEKSQPLDINIDLGLIVTPHNEIDFSIWKKANVKVLDLSANSNNYGWPKFL